MKGRDRPTDRKTEMTAVENETRQLKILSSQTNFLPARSVVLILRLDPTSQQC